MTGYRTLVANSPGQGDIPLEAEPLFQNPGQRWMKIQAPGNAIAQGKQAGSEQRQRSHRIGAARHFERDGAAHSQGPGNPISLLPLAAQHA